MHVSGNVFFLSVAVEPRVWLRRQSHRWSPIQEPLQYTVIAYRQTHLNRNSGRQYCG